MKMDDKILDKVMPAFEEFVSKRGGLYQDPTVNLSYALIKGEQMINIRYSTCFGVLSNGASGWTGGKTITYEGTDAIAVQINRKDKINAKEAALYYEWLFNFSPWRNAFLLKDVSQVWDYGAFMLNADLDDAVMIGGGIAARHVWESYAGSAQLPALISLWTKMVEKGMNPNFAYIAATNLRQSAEGYAVAAHGFGHQPLKFANEDDNIHANFALDRVRKGQPTFKGRGAYRGGTSVAFSGAGNTGIPNFRKWMTDIVRENGKKAAKKVNPFSLDSSAPTVSKRRVVGLFKEMEEDFMKGIAA
jgi:hypothetical protein